MDQNTPRDDASGTQPPADPGSGDAGAWNQAPGQDQSQAAPGGGQEAAAEHAAWSADASYQQQQAAQAQQQAAQAQQQQAAQAQQQQAAPADTQAYAAPEPQAATYSEQPAPAADPQQQYTQQQYDQAAYAQQQQQYAQQQQQYAQQQQQQQYGEQQQQQPQYYDQSAYGQQQQQQPQYYDQSAYGQQPGYYDQSAYGQQQQQGYPQQPGQPYAYAQPGQDQYWDQGASGGYGRSFLAVVSAFLLLTWGLVIGITGGFVLWTENILSHLSDVTLSAEVLELVEEADREIFAVGAVLIILGIIHMIAAVGVFGHRRWGRAFAIVLGLLGTIIGLAAMFVAVGFEALDVGFNNAFKGEETSLAAAAFVFITYLVILVSMFVGKRHFKKKGVEG